MQVQRDSARVLGKQRRGQRRKRVGTIGSNAAVWQQREEEIGG
jgi:hypothetical protein